MVYAAGILILTLLNGKYYALLGKDHYNTYSDFGGKSDLIDYGNTIATAAREAYEETCGSLFSIYELKNKLQKCDLITTLSYTKKTYNMYVMFIQYDCKAPYKFNKVYQYIKNIPFLNKYKEKIEIQWIPLQDVFSNKVNLRNIFQKTIDNHRNTILKIAYKYTSTNRTYNNG